MSEKVWGDWEDLHRCAVGTRAGLGSGQPLLAVAGPAALGLRSALPVQVR
jgi:hypothetical protein